MGKTLVIYMTSFIQMIIDNLINVTPIFINGAWIEVDCIDDLKQILYKGFLYVLLIIY